jgi:GDP-D-mannose dehydratase
MSIEEKEIVSVIEYCRLCRQSNLQDVIDLGEQYITSRFPVYGDWSTPKTKITLCLCMDCELLQLKQSTMRSELYEHEYGYMSGISNTMRAHLKDYQQEIVSHLGGLSDGDIVVDIGSNDSTMLQLYPPNVRRIGVDPTGKQFAKFYGDVELLPTYFTKENVETAFGNIRCKMISSISMFYDLPDPVQFAKDIYFLLDTDGIWTCEQSYMPTMLERNSIDTICHEHLEYYALKQIALIATSAGFQIFDVSFNDCNGGSFRIYFAKKESKKYSECTAKLSQILEKEAKLSLGNPNTYSNFVSACSNQVQNLKQLIHAIKQSGESMFIYGASTKGNCLLQFADIGEALIPYAVERNLNKVGKMTNTGVPIISEETMRKNPPKYLLVLPWHFRDEIVKREDEFLSAGGQLVFPFPHLEIYSKVPKVLITGNTGLIGTELSKQLLGKYTMYGFSRYFSARPGVIQFEGDANDGFFVNNIFEIIKPDVVFNLAGISNSKLAKQNCLETCISNGMSVVMLCEMIRRLKPNTKLIHASSSEIYKGHLDYTVQEDDTHMNHLHPYSIAKTLAHNTVKMYRENGFQFSNATIFTTESKNKRGDFLLNKVAHHAISVKHDISVNKGHLRVGDLSSSRDILHVSDVARALICIMESSVSQDYLVCRNENVVVEDLVKRIYKNFGINLEKRDNNYVDVVSGNRILEIDSHMGNETIACHIRGAGTKLRSLGWSPQITIEDIIHEICLLDKT